MVRWEEQRHTATLQTSSHHIRSQNKQRNVLYLQGKISVITWPTSLMFCKPFQWRRVQVFICWRISMFEVECFRGPACVSVARDRGPSSTATGIPPPGTSTRACRRRRSSQLTGSCRVSRLTTSSPSHRYQWSLSAWWQCKSVLRPGNCRKWFKVTSAN